MQELDVVTLVADLPEFGLKEGDRGTIVHIDRGGAAFMIEFVAPDGRTVALTTLRPDQVRPEA